MMSTSKMKIFAEALSKIDKQAKDVEASLKKMVEAHAKLMRSELIKKYMKGGRLK